MLLDFSNRKDPMEDRLALFRRWIGSCTSARYLHSRVIEDEEGYESRGKHLLVHVALVSPLHEEINFVRDDLKVLFMKKGLRAGLMMSDDHAIDCRPLWAIKREREIELICVVMQEADELLLRDAQQPQALLMANDNFILHIVPFAPSNET